MAETGSSSDGDTPGEHIDRHGDKAVLINLFQDPFPVDYRGDWPRDGRSG